MGLGFSNSLPTLREKNYLLVEMLLNNWDQRIAEDIYERTSGHAELVCFCGKQIQHKIERGDKESIHFS